MGNEKVSLDFLSKVKAIKAGNSGKDKKNIDSRFEYAAISVWLIRYSNNLNKAEKIVILTHETPDGDAIGKTSST